MSDQNQSGDSGKHGTARLDRPTPAWYDDAKLGIFVQWGLYSVPGWATTTGTLDEAGGRFDWETWFRENAYAEWYLNTLRIAGSPTADFHKEHYGDAPYEEFAAIFDAANKDWDAAAFAAMVKDAGAQYVVLTSKHHDGFCLWPSRVPNPVKGDYHAARDLVGDMAAAVRAEGLRFATYYSGGLDWTMNPEPITNRIEVGSTVLQDKVAADYFDAHWRELIARYDIAIMWNDIGYPLHSDLPQIVANFYARTPDGLVNDRFQHFAADGTASYLVPPDYVTPEYRSFDAIRPDKWETCRGIGFSFGYNRQEDDRAFLPVDELIRFFVDVVSKNGNLLLNVGPHADGTVQEGQQIRLRALGAWLRVNGDAIYGTRPWTVADGASSAGIPVRFTQKNGDLYATLLGQPEPGPLVLKGLTAAAGTTVERLGGSRIASSGVDGGLRVEIPAGLPDSPVHAFRISPAPTWTGAN